MRLANNINSRLSRLKLSTNRRNFIAGLWHGAFLALGVSLTQPTTVISAFVADLTGSTVWVGGLSTVLTVAGALPQLFVARWIEPRPRKMPYLMLAIYLRVISWGVLAGLIFVIGGQHPMTLAWILVGMLVIFYAGGGLGNIPYTDIIGKIIPSHRRGAFFGGKGALAGPLSVGAAFVARYIMAHVDYPNNYAMLFGLAALGLGIASLGFWVIREPANGTAAQAIPPWSEYGQQLLAAGRRLKILIAIQLLTGFSLMALPFYVVYARQELNAPADAVGWFLLAQVLGGVISNLVWAHLVDRSGSRWMLFCCAVTSTLTPILAIALSPLGWLALLPVFFFAGAIFNGRSVGFQSALLELAPQDERPTYAALNTILILPVAFLSLAAGVFLQHWSYTALFAFAAIFIGLGAIITWRWATTPQPADQHITA
ncbi:MAG: MFS transporter [Chloroflexota bacterium]|nr:MFS transporter [Chloroflexota bacterium]